MRVVRLDVGHCTNGICWCVGLSVNGAHSARSSAVLGDDGTRSGDADGDSILILSSLDASRFAWRM